MIRFNIRTKLTLLLLVFGMLPIMAVMPVVFNKLSVLQEDTLKDMYRSAEQVGELIDRNLFERYGDVQAFTTNAASKDERNWYKTGVDNPLISSMNSYMSNYGVYKLMMLVDVEGKVAAVNSLDSKGNSIGTAELYGHSFKDATWFRKAINKEFLKGEAVNGTAVEPPQYEPIVSRAYNSEDGFVIPFAAPVSDYSGKTIGVWVNFADFGLVEDIVKSVYLEKKASGMPTVAFAVGDEKGTILVNYDPTARGDVEKRDAHSIGKKSLKELEIPAALDALKTETGSKIDRDEVSGEDDAVSWTKTNGAMGYPGLGWTVIMHQPAQDAFASIIKTKHLLFMVIGVALAFIVLAGAFIGTLTSRPLLRIANEIARLSNGDFSKGVQGLNRQDEMGQMSRALGAFITKMQQTIGSIIEAAQAVNAAASEIASGSTDLSQRTEEQASSLEETAASMEQITGTVKQNSSNAATANELSSKANQVASDGGKVVEEAVTAMGSIEQSSKKISDIIGVIDEIAFQTNLLALNAAVEAARAGDAGKGFAVVASEVRSLAGRSASASKEIKALINESAMQVQTGAQLVNQAGETLRGIVQSVKQVSSIVSEIASASNEQATGIDEINTAITQMDEVTQQNAALVEENTAAATSMVEQARELERLMSFFTLSEEEGNANSHPNVVSLNTAGSTKARPVSKPALKAAAHVRAKPIKVAGAKKGYDEGWQEF